MAFLLLLCGACDSAFFGAEAEKPPPIEPPKQAKVPTRPKECQVAMDLLTTCEGAREQLEPSRITAVAECANPTYLGDTELMAFLRCLGDAPDCAQLARCSGPITTPTEAAPK